jgi:outer membrane protein TolC
MLKPDKVIKTFVKKYHILMCISVLFLIVCTKTSYSFTLDEALSLAKENLPSYKASLIGVQVTEALYNASLSPYLPSLDASTIQSRRYVSGDDFPTRFYDVTLSYTLFDGGNRWANRNIARLNLDINKESLRENLLDLEFNVKIAFYTVIAIKEAVEHRKIQLQHAKKDYEIAEGRHALGAAKLSDVLQASVRLEQAKLDVIQSEGDFKKAFSDLNSLIGRPLDTEYNLEGSLDLDAQLPERERIAHAALQRPDIKQARDSQKIAAYTKSLTASALFPALSAHASYIKSSGGISGSTFPEEKVASLTATWTIFELANYFNLKSSRLEEDVALENLTDLKRQVLLDTYKTYEDFLTAVHTITVAKQRLKNAEHNFSQARGEYKVGKGDILSLVLAESTLADAREQLIISKLDLMLSKALLENITGVEKLESLINEKKE